MLRAWGWLVQVAAAAAEEGPTAQAASKADDDADVRGPHAALAVRLQVGCHP